MLRIWHIRHWRKRRYAAAVNSNSDSLCDPTPHASQKFRSRAVYNLPARWAYIQNIKHTYIKALNSN